MASSREIVERVEVNFTRERARMKVTAASAIAPVAWKLNPEIMKSLDGITLKGLTAKEFLEGTRVSDVDIPVIEESRQTEAIGSARSSEQEIEDEDPDS